MGFVESRIGVIGAGYVGLVSGVCFAKLGHLVEIFDISDEKISSLKKAKVPIFEPGLDELVAEVVNEKKLSFSSSLGEFYSKNYDAVLIAVGTPERADGSCNTDFVFDAVKDAARGLKGDCVLVLKSTVPVGTASGLREVIKKISPPHKISIVNNPEFLKEGEAINDFLNPERIVLGSNDKDALLVVKKIYEPLTSKGHKLIETDSETAELCKLSANLALASRVTLINQIATLSRAVGADIKKIETILKSDSRIGSRYLFAGLGYGGSCFPKDVQNFVSLCKEKNVDASFAEATHSFNQKQKLFFLEDLKANFKKGSKIALLGLAFKTGTDDVREAPSLLLSSELSKLGMIIQGFDPQASHKFIEFMRQNKIENVSVMNSASEALIGADAVIVASDWPELKSLPKEFKQIFKGRKIYDGKNLYDPHEIKALGYEYMRVG